MSGARLWRYESGLGRLVLRAWPGDGASRVVLEQIHEWLRDAGTLGFVPVPIPGLDGRTLHEHAGRFWDVSPWMPGTADRNGPPSPGRVAAGFSALAAFHQRLARHATTGPSAGLLARRQEVDWLLGGGFAVYERSLDECPADPLRELARQWISEARRQAFCVKNVLERAAGVVVPLQPCLRDIRADHLLFNEDRLTGLVDFGAMGPETVAADLGRLASEWLGPDRGLRSIGLDAYHAVRPLLAAETALIDVFEQSAALLGAGHWVRWHFLDGRRFEDPQAVSRGIARGLDRLRISPTRS